MNSNPSLFGGLLSFVILAAAVVTPLVIVTLWGYARRIDKRMQRLNEQFDELLMHAQRQQRGQGPAVKPPGSGY